MFYNQSIKFRVYKFFPFYPISPARKVPALQEQFSAYWMTESHNSSISVIGLISINNFPSKLSIMRKNYKIIISTKIFFLTNTFIKQLTFNFFNVNWSMVIWINFTAIHKSQRIPKWLSTNFFWC